MTDNTAEGHNGAHAARQTPPRYVRHSFIHRWLTKEPDPDVVVIDLRETYAVGPVIGLLDRLAAPVGCAWRTSEAARLIESLHGVGKQLSVEYSHTVRLLAAALEPPESPGPECTDSRDENQRE